MQFFNQIEEIARKEKWLRLRDRNIKRETEAVRHIVFEFPKLAQNEYKRRHDWVARKVHWQLYRKNRFDVNEKWYKREPVKVVENDSEKICDVTN